MCSIFLSHTASLRWPRAGGGGTMMELLSVAGTRIVSGRRGGGGVVYLKVES